MLCFKDWVRRGGSLQSKLLQALSREVAQDERDRLAKLLARRRSENALDHRRVTRRDRDVLHSVDDAALVHDLAIGRLEVRNTLVGRGKFCVGMQRSLCDRDHYSTVGIGGFLQLLLGVLDVLTCALLVGIPSATVGMDGYIPLRRSPKVKAHSAHCPSTKRLAE